MIARPMYTDKILSFADTTFVKILTGVRRCGKSTILKMVEEAFKERGIEDAHILTYHFDSLEYEDLKTAKSLYEHIKTRLHPHQTTYIFLDEIQEVASWEKVVNSLMIDYDVDIYVTGSNSRMLSSEISTYLTGRYISFHVYPLSFQEYLTFSATYRSVKDTYKEFIEYVKQGGFPSVHLRAYSQNEIYTIVKDIYNATIFTDIVKRNRIRKVDHLERIVRFVFDHVGQTFSAMTISKYLKNEQRMIDVETVYHYLSTLENAYIIHRCSRYDVQGKEILKTQEKFYVADSAFRYAILGYTRDSIAAMMENLVYLELKRRGYEVYVGKFEEAEIDFVATRLENKLYIQVTMKIESEQTEKREYSRLLSIRDNYPKYVLRLDEFSAGNYEGIKTMHIADFLLSDEY